MTDITDLKRRLIDRAVEVAEHLLPRGVLHGREWSAGSIAGEPGESLKVCIRGDKAGRWSDFAGHGEGGDLIDLWCSVKHLSLVQALDDIRSWLGIESPRFDKRNRAYVRPEQPKWGPPVGPVLASVGSPPTPSAS